MEIFSLTGKLFFVQTIAGKFSLQFQKAPSTERRWKALPLLPGNPFDSASMVNFASSSKKHLVKKFQEKPSLNSRKIFFKNFFKRG
jgi:hypothetical protein